MSERKLELYFHIPFCVRKCLYCDFLSAPATKNTRNSYMEALLDEVEGRAEEYREFVVDTIFIGGGTPSAVEAIWIERLLGLVKQSFRVADTAEVTIEVNPGTVDAKKLKQYVRAGINRLSIGLQSANDEELKMLGRIHTWQDFQNTYELARSAGFQNINVDIMSALPNQTLDSYCATLERVLQLSPPPEHISAYSLIVEEETPFAEMEQRGVLALPDEECEREMYEKTAELLGLAGFVRYEISNYAREGFACRHNCGYWRRVDYAGFGIGAASLIRNVRFQNKESIEDYMRNPCGCRGNQQILTVEEQMEEFMFLGLRMTDGVGENEFRENFDRELNEVYGEVIRRNCEDGLLQRVPVGTKAYRLALTARGMDVSNYVMAQFLLE